ncbi:energy-coupling factor transporter transmembrane component T family protein [Pseudotabrizicola algicola]|uniref:Energy-coupling factor transporter transmembrane protein EcfT n=1 Tax=Pseudotabrizicola algicola TaxID=2709381 RepID=A0A6B3RTK5_9RHOB|nr:energy-coupling factor transporter transmembrane protein EcfT [Pseudotabrizicola algicola]NEX48526.1 energy-coupling factor transporter transmembrane protein EcfT [Pseudotabrizicola algicola]
MLTLTSPVDTPLHRLRAGHKLGALAVFTFGLFWVSAPLVLSVALLVVAGLYLAAGRRFSLHGLHMLRPLWPFVVVVALWHLWLKDPASGATIIMRMVTAVAAANLVTMTTRLSDMIGVLERLARPLAPVLPPRRLALAIALVIRFIPVLSERAAQLAQAWRARSGKAPRWRLFAPVALAALDDAETAAEALRARGGAG